MIEASVKKHLSDFASVALAMTGIKSPAKNSLSIRHNIMQQWNEAWQQKSDATTSPKNCIRLLLGSIDLLPGMQDTDKSTNGTADGADLGLKDFCRQFASVSNERPMLYCIVRHGCRKWITRIVDQGHIPIWEEGMCMALNETNAEYDDKVRLDYMS